jgi:hypothetical protein
MEAEQINVRARLTSGRIKYPSSENEKDDMPNEMSVRRTAWTTPKVCFMA